MKKTQRLLALLLALVMTLSLAACGAQKTLTEDENTAPETRVFTDSVGREVTVPAQIDQVAVSGPMAQIVLFALCPDKLVGISNAWDESAAQYLDTEYYNLPLLGQLYGGKGELNLETLLESGAQVVIDVGEAKGSIVEDLDALQEQTNIPFVHIDAALASMDETYTLLGDLLGMPDEAKTLADYCRSTYDRALTIADSVEKANLLYITGDAGLNVIAQGAYHAEVIDLLSNNLAAVDDPSSKGTGNEVDMEQILNWNPDVILFAPDSIYDTVGDDATWQGVTAIQNGAYYEVPMGPYNWMGFPPSVQRLLGMLWMAKVLYPEAADYDLYTEAAEYFKLFYHCDLTREQYDALVANSLGR
ncbi:MAG: ABC transporter substrate-binding protein [Vescimonas sp.]